MREQISALQRLQELPPLFQGSDLTIRFQWSSKNASQYLYLWKRRGLVQGLGGHSDVFANLLRQPAPDWETALLMAMPSGIYIGVEALRLAGWTTQIQGRPDVAVKAGYRVFSVRPFRINPRKGEWFETVQPGVLKRRPGMPVLRPAWALADMLSVAGWGRGGLWPDDILEDGFDETDWLAACRAFALTPDRLRCDRMPSKSKLFGVLDRL